MTIFEKDNWKLRWGLYWTWPHIVRGNPEKEWVADSYYFGPFVLEVMVWVYDRDLEDEDQGWIPLFIMFSISVIAFVIAKSLGH